MDFFNFLKEKINIILYISLILNVILIICCSILFYFNFSKDCVCEDNNLLTINNEEDDNNDENINKEEENLEKYFVEIKGAIKNPGVYEVNQNNIINDVVKLAGGFNKDAYTNNINLSRKVVNELVIYVYKNDEMTKAKTSDTKQEKCYAPTYDISDCTKEQVSEITPNKEDSTPTNSEQKESKKTSDEKKIININTASLEELMTLTGIGEQKAKDIISYRNQKGNFKNIEEIKNVSGIKDATFNKIKEYITV